MLEKIKENLNTLLKSASIQDDIKVESIELIDDCYYINLSGDEVGHILGKGGQNLNSLQSVLRQSLFKVQDDPINLNIDLNEYKKNREEKIKEDVDDKIKIVRVTGESFKMNATNPYERRIVHNYVGGIEGITSESVGYGDTRSVVLKLS